MAKILGMGTDSYLTTATESNYGTKGTGSPKDIPCDYETKISGMVENIENSRAINSRLKQKNSKGAVVCNGEIVMDAAPSLMGRFLSYFLGSSTGVNASSAYTHTFLCPILGEKLDRSFSMFHTTGSGLADEYYGSIVTGMTISVAAKEQCKVTFKTVSQNYKLNSARATSFTYPSLIPFNFSNIVVINKTGSADFKPNSMSLELDLNYDMEDYRLGSNAIIQPNFKGIPTASLSLNVDADKDFIDAAKSHAMYKIWIQALSTENITGNSSGGTTKYQMDIELPACQLSPETTAELSPERLKMDLEFDCGFGGVTTKNSGSRMFEIRVVDGNATY